MSVPSAECDMTLASFSSSTDDVCSLASTLAMPGQPVCRLEKTQSRRFSAAMFSSLRVSSSAARPSIASLFKRASSPPPAPLGHILAPLPDFGDLDVAAPVPEDPVLSASPDPDVPAAAPIAAPVAVPRPQVARRRAPSIASVSSEESCYSDSEEQSESIETPNTSLSHLASSVGSPKRMRTPLLVIQPIAEEPERGRKRSDASLLRHVASQTFERPSIRRDALPKRSHSTAPKPSASFLRPVSPVPRFLRSASPAPSARRVLGSLGLLSSAQNSEASLGAPAGSRAARTVRRIFSRRGPLSQPDEDDRDASDFEDYEMLSIPRDAGWRGMERYGGAGGQGPTKEPKAALTKRKVLIVRLDSGNNFDLGLGAFEAVRRHFASYGAVSSIQVDSSLKRTVVGVVALPMRRRTAAETALRVEFRDKNVYETVCPTGASQTVEMRGVGRVVLELVEHK
ncbi:hypothetical protein AURDEDRAFT_148989 [Auricularia subglabra TFB-10046 SS5]|nr:hypothetical protein AURDEDRAFT_148989 [Auricularia subglabra TFB-10046 SS5]